MAGADIGQVYNTASQSALQKQETATQFAMASQFANMAGGFVDYSLLQGDIQNYYTQAGGVELQAKQRANQLRESFIQNVGSYTFGATRRGIDVKSASVQDNIKASSEAMNQDIQTMQKDAKMQAKTLRSQAKINKIASTSNLITGTISNLGMMGALYYGGAK